MCDICQIIPPAEQHEMWTHANAIGCVWVAAHEHHTHRLPTTWIRLLRTLAQAAQTGVTEQTLQETIQMAKQKGG